MVLIRRTVILYFRSIIFFTFYILVGGESDDNADTGGFLKVFKLNHGYKLELFDDLFIKPTELQEALMLEPSKRMVEHIEIISTTLRLFPFLRGLSDSSISDLANIVEYRALTSQDELFSQNLPSSAMCLLLKGNIQVKMFNPINAITTKDIMLGDLPQYSTFGYIDFLFRHTNQFIVKELQDILYPSATSNQNKNNNLLYNSHNDSFYSAVSAEQSLLEEQPLAVSPGGAAAGKCAIVFVYF